MARKDVKMEELVEVLYQRHKGRNIGQIKYSLGLDRKTIRKYIELAEPYGFLRDDEVRDEGVPMRIILDNLKSGILRPNTYDPVFNRAYGECAKHFGFIIDPAKIARGDHKGKVERKIPVVRQIISSGFTNV